jgi:hypothetical protein
MEYSYKLLNNDVEVINYNSDEDKIDFLTGLLDSVQTSAGEFRISVVHLGKEVFSLPGITRKEGINIIRELRENSEFNENEAVKRSNEPAELTKGKKKVVKWFIGLFMGFSILSFILRLRDYSKIGGGLSIFNSVITLLLIFFVCFGLWIFFFKNKATNKVEE